MPRNFNIPLHFRSTRITNIKKFRNDDDLRKKDLSPTLIDCGPVRFKLARNFGFCFGVENAIEIAYRALEENPNKRVFLLSEIIHNPEVNRDLKQHGVQFLMTTEGSPLIPLETLNSEDIVILPAFGVTLELQQILAKLGINTYSYDSTCPFVRKVWKRTNELGELNFTVIIHGKRSHEETRATFSHSKVSAPTLVIENIEEAKFVAAYINNNLSQKDFKEYFSTATSENFNPEQDLIKVGVVNQTTMLAPETKEISSLLRQAMIQRYGAVELKEHFADTSDTLCYATYENQEATQSLINSNADLALIIGGYNSSNTSHLVEICQKQMPSYFIKNSEEILSKNAIRHFDLSSQKCIVTTPWLFKTKDKSANHDPLQIAITSGASCPDYLIDETMQSIAEIFGCTKDLEHALVAFSATKNLVSISRSKP